MADMATYIGVTPVTARLGAAAVARGLRIVGDSSNLYTVAGIGVRGDYITLRDGVAGEDVPVVSVGTPAKVPVVASEALVVGDLLYSAALGKTSKTAGGGAIVIGRCKMAASGDGVLGEAVLLPAA